MQKKYLNKFIVEFLFLLLLEDFSYPAAVSSLSPNYTE